MAVHAGHHEAPPPVKILLLSYFYAPEVSPGAYRWTPVAERWIEQGFEVDVVCAWKPGLLRRETINGVRVHRTGGGIVEQVRKRLRGGTAQRGQTGADAAARSADSLSKRLHDLTWKKVYWPDFACPWFLPALREARRLLVDGGRDAMLSTSFPFTTHVVALAAKRFFPGVSWTVHMGDPFSFVEGTPNNNQALYGDLNYRAEKMVFARADAVAVTPEARDRYAEVFPESAAKFTAVRLLLPSLEDVRDGERVFPADGKKRFVYVGRLYRLVRRPDFLLRLFEMLLRERPDGGLELHFFGDVDECRESFRPYEAMIGESIFLHGTVSRERALRAVEHSAVVVNISNDTRYQMPSKVVEYAAAGKPVLNLTKIEDDSSLRFFEGYPAVLNMMDTGGAPTRAQAEELARFVDTAPATMRGANLEGWLAPFRPEAVAASYEELLRRGMSDGWDRTKRTDFSA